MLGETKKTVEKMIFFVNKMRVNQGLYNYGW